MQRKNKINFLLLCVFILSQCNVYTIQPSTTHNNTWFWPAVSIGTFVVTVGGYFSYQWYKKNKEYNAPARELLREMAKKDNDQKIHLCMFHTVREESVKLNAGTLINATDSKGRTALSLAAESGDEKLVEKMLRASELLNQKCENGGINEERVDINKASANGKTPLRYASRNGHQNIVSLLLRAKADVSA